MSSEKRHGLRSSKIQRLKEIRAFIQLCFHVIDEPDPYKLAQMTGLCVSTIYRLARGEATLCTHIGTVQALGKVAGLWLSVEGDRVRIRAA
mgnify:CR=1 FL=1